MRERVRVAYLIGSLDAAGGAEGQVATLATALDPRRYVPHVIMLKRRNDFAERLASAGIGVTVLDRKGRWDADLLRRCRSALASVRPDVLHSYLLFPNLLGVPLGRSVGVPTIITSQRGSYESNLRAWPAGFWRRLGRWANSAADAVVFNAQACLREERAAGLGADRAHWIPNAVVLPDLPPNQPATPRLVVCVGRLEPVKGHDLLLAAWPRVLARCPDARLILVGEGRSRPRLEAQARRLGVAAGVSFAGRTPAADHLAGCRLLAQPSRSEGMPNAVLEAMAWRRPVVATRVGDVPNLVIDAETGYLVPPGQPDALATAIVALLADAPLAERLGAAGRTRAGRFSVDALARAHEALYEACLGRQEGSVGRAGSTVPQRP